MLSRLTLARMVAPTPSRRALSVTFFTKSGRALALARRLFPANAITIRSVPAEISEAPADNRIAMAEERDGRCFAIVGGGQAAASAARALRDAGFTGTVGRMW